LGNIWYANGTAYTVVVFTLKFVVKILPRLQYSWLRHGGKKEKASNSVFNQKYHQFHIEEVFNE
jgi:hypothetical protein